jgi:hypothetical protein
MLECLSNQLIDFALEESANYTGTPPFINYWAAIYKILRMKRMYQITMWRSILILEQNTSCSCVTMSDLCCRLQSLYPTDCSFWPPSYFWVLEFLKLRCRQCPGTAHGSYWTRTHQREDRYFFWVFPPLDLTSLLMPGRSGFFHKKACIIIMRSS